jgi:hypothetical protein
LGIKSRRKKWVGQVERMEVRGNPYTLLVERYEERTIKRSRYKRKEKIKMDLGVIGECVLDFSTSG